MSEFSDEKIHATPMQCYNIILIAQISIILEDVDIIVTCLCLQMLHCYCIYYLKPKIEITSMKCAYILFWVYNTLYIFFFSSEQKMFLTYLRIHNNICKWNEFERVSD